MEFTVGQEVWLRTSDNAVRYGGQNPWWAVTVSKVGRKYVYITDPQVSYEIKFDLDGHEVTNVGSARAIYTDEGKARFERKQEVRGRLRDLGVDMGYRTSFSLEAQEAVADLLEADLCRNEKQEG